jgi:phage tail-like protein
MPEAAPTPPATSDSGAQPGTFVDPLGVFNWRVEVAGMTEMHFTRCTGLGVRVHSPRYREAGMTQVVHRLVGPTEYADIKLEYGLTTSREMWDWLWAAVEGRVRRMNISIVMLDSDGSTEKLRWNLTNAWPSEWSGAMLDAMGNEVALESLTLVFETLERA